MSSNGSWFDASEFPRLSIVLKVLVGTLILVPFVFLRLYQWVISDIGANSFEPFPALAWGLIAAFALSLPSACTAVFVYQFIARRSKGKTNAA